MLAAGDVLRRVRGSALAQVRGFALAQVRGSALAQVRGFALARVRGSAEDGVHEGIRVERGQVIGALAEADELDGNT